MFSRGVSSGPPQCAGLGQSEVWGAGAASAAAKRAEAMVMNCIFEVWIVKVGKAIVRFL